MFRNSRNPRNPAPPSPILHSPGPSTRSVSPVPPPPAQPWTGDSHYYISGREYVRYYYGALPPLFQPYPYGPSVLHPAPTYPVHNTYPFPGINYPPPYGHAYGNAPMATYPHPDVYQNNLVGAMRNDYPALAATQSYDSSRSVVAGPGNDGAYAGAAGTPIRPPTVEETQAIFGIRSDIWGQRLASEPHPGSSGSSTQAARRGRAVLGKMTETANKTGKAVSAVTKKLINKVRPSRSKKGKEVALAAGYDSDMHVVDAVPPGPPTDEMYEVDMSANESFPAMLPSPPIVVEQYPVPVVEHDIAITAAAASSSMDVLAAPVPSRAAAPIPMNDQSILDQAHTTAASITATASHAPAVLDDHPAEPAAAEHAVVAPFVLATPAHTAPLAASAPSPNNLELDDAAFAAALARESGIKTRSSSGPIRTVKLSQRAAVPYVRPPLGDEKKKKGRGGAKYAILVDENAEDRMVREAQEAKEARRNEKNAKRRGSTKAASSGPAVVPGVDVEPRVASTSANTLANHPSTPANSTVARGSSEPPTSASASVAPTSDNTSTAANANVVPKSNDASTATKAGSSSSWTNSVDPRILDDPMNGSTSSANALVDESAAAHAEKAAGGSTQKETHYQASRATAGRVIKRKGVAALVVPPSRAVTPNGTPLFRITDVVPPVAAREPKAVEKRKRKHGEVEIDTAPIPTPASKRHRATPAPTGRKGKETATPAPTGTRIRTRASAKKTKLVTETGNVDIAMSDAVVDTAAGPPASLPPNPNPSNPYVPVFPSSVPSVVPLLSPQASASGSESLLNTPENGDNRLLSQGGIAGSSNLGVNLRGVGLQTEEFQQLLPGERERIIRESVQLLLGVDYPSWRAWIRSLDYTSRPRLHERASAIWLSSYGSLKATLARVDAYAWADALRSRALASTTGDSSTTFPQEEDEDNSWMDFVDFEAGTTEADAEMPYTPVESLLSQAIDGCEFLEEGEKQYLHATLNDISKGIMPDTTRLFAERKTAVIAIVGAEVYDSAKWLYETSGPYAQSESSREVNEESIHSLARQFITYLLPDDPIEAQCTEARQDVRRLIGVLGTYDLDAARKWVNALLVCMRDKSSEMASREAEAHRREEDERRRQEVEERLVLEKGYTLGRISEEVIADRMKPPRWFWRGMEYDSLPQRFTGVRDPFFEKKGKQSEKKKSTSRSKKKF